MKNLSDFKTKIFLDGGDPNETKDAVKLLGFLDGQTTNPTLISKNPEVTKRLEEGEKFSREDILDFYRSIVEKISKTIPKGSVSVEVYADKSTTSEEMLAQSRNMFSWIDNAHIKLPVTKEGLKAAKQSVKEGIRINITLCFTQEQAAAVYAATRGATKGQLFVSPFVGRLDDQGKNGMDLIKNIIEMFKTGDGHVEVLTASIRNLDHIFRAIGFGSDIMTIPYKTIKEWSDKKFLIPDSLTESNLSAIPYKKTSLDKNWLDYNISHELTDMGLQKFSDDWNKLIK